MADQVSVRKSDETSKVQAALEQTKGTFKEVTQYISDVKVETKKVTWPGKQEIYGTTVMVILTTFVFGIYFWICDQTFSFAVHRVLNYLMHRG